MTKSNAAPEEIVSFGKRCAEAVAGDPGGDTIIERVRVELSGLLEERALFARLLRSTFEGADYPDVRQPTMFDNEVLLYSDPDRLFSLRMFLWRPGKYTQVHDHGSWGVIGPVTGMLDVVNYRREDDGTEADRASLVEADRLMLKPGETTYTVALDEGIHKTGNPTGDYMLSLSVYGAALPRGYINGFDPATGRMWRTYPPRVKKQLFALAALHGLDATSAGEALSEASGHRLEAVSRADFDELRKIR